MVCDVGKWRQKSYVLIVTIIINAATRSVIIYQGIHILNALVSVWTALFSSLMDAFIYHCINIYI